MEVSLANYRLLARDLRGWGHEEKGTTEDEMAGWHQGFYAHEFG